MMINRDNYEAYLLDKIEGRLTAQEERDLMLFLEENPDLESEEDIFYGELTADEIFFPGKDDLKKGAIDCGITEKNFHQFCIAKSEGDLSDEAISALETFLSKNPGCKKDAELYEQLKLIPDTSIRFTAKNRLKRAAITPKAGKSLPLREIYYSLSVAATLAILLALSIFMRNSHLNNQEEIVITSNLPTVPAHTIEPFTIAEPEIADNIEQRVSETFPEEDEPVATYIEYSSEPDVPPDAGFIALQNDLHPLQSRKATTISPNHNQITQTARSLTLTGNQDIKTQDHYPGVRGSTVNNITGFFSAAAENRPLSSTLASIGQQEREAKVTVWEIAEAGIKGINAIAGTELSIDREVDNESGTVKMGVNLHVIEFQRSARR